MNVKYFGTTFLTLGSLISCSNEKTNDRPNIILIMTDDQG